MLNWLFEIGAPNAPAYRLALASMTYNFNAYTGVVDPGSFRGVVLNRVKVEMDQITRSEVSLDIIGSYSLSALIGQPLVIRVVAGSDVADMIGAWQYQIESASMAYGVISITAVDQITSVMDGVWPTTELIRDVFPESVFSHAGLDEAACLPVVFGEYSYIPLQSKSIDGEVYYILGTGTGSSHDIVEITSPNEIDNQREYTPDTDIWLDESSDGTYEYFQVYLESGMETSRCWRSGADRVPPIARYSKNGYDTYDNPVDVLKYVLEDCGIPSTDFDPTWETAATTVEARGYFYSRGFYQHVNRVKLVCHLLAACDATLYQSGNRVAIAINSKTPVVTIDSSKVIKPSMEEHGDFSWNRTLPSKNDSGYITYFTHGEPQTRIVKAKVTASGTVLTPSNEALDLSGVGSSIAAQKLGTLYFLKKYCRNGECSFTGHPDLISLVPGQVVTIDDPLYGPPTAAIVESLTINKDSTVKVACSTYSTAILDFSDLSPSSITPVADTATGAISTLSQAVESGPYIPVVYVPGALTSSQVLLYHVFSEQGATFPADLGGSTAKAMDAATTSTVVDIQKNGTSVGSITWGASATSGTFTFTTETTFVEGDTLALIGPATADATLGYISVTLKGTKL